MIYSGLYYTVRWAILRTVLYTPSDDNPGKDNMKIAGVSYTELSTHQPI